MIPKKALSRSLKRLLSDLSRLIVHLRLIQRYLFHFDLAIHSHNSWTMPRTPSTPLPCPRLRQFTSTQSPRTTDSKQDFWLRRQMARLPLQHLRNFHQTPITRHYEKSSPARLRTAPRSIRLRPSPVMSRLMTVATIPVPIEKTHGSRTKATHFASTRLSKELLWPRRWPLIPSNIVGEAPLHHLAVRPTRIHCSPPRMHAEWSRVRRRTRERAYSAHERHQWSSTLPSVEPLWEEIDQGILVPRDVMRSG